MEVQEITFTTTAQQVHIVKAVASMMGNVTIGEAVRGLLYLGLTKALDEDWMPLDGVDKILAAEAAGAMESASEDEIKALIWRHLNIVVDLEKSGAPPEKIKEHEEIIRNLKAAI